MPRPCQRRRESAANQRKSKPKKPKPPGDAEPVWIKHKARQKAIHNARHGRGRGGRPSRNQRSGNSNANQAEQDFISFASNGNNFNVLNAAGSQRNPIMIDGDDVFQYNDLIPGNGTDEDDSDDMDMHETDDMMINVEVGRVSHSMGSISRPEVMFSVAEAIAIYKMLHRAGFPLSTARADRYEKQEESCVSKTEGTHQTVGIDLLQFSRTSFKSDTVVGASTAVHNQNPSAANTTSAASNQLPLRGHPQDTIAFTGDSAVPSHESRNPARSYLFEWGVHKGKSFNEVPDSYIRTIAGDPYLLDKYPAAKDAFDYHRPGLRRTEPTAAQRAVHERDTVKDKTKKGKNKKGNTPNQNALKEAAPKVNQGKVSVSWENYRLPAGTAHAQKRLDQVDEHYLRTIEGMPKFSKKWNGLKEALQDYNEKTGRRPKGSR